jgi:hypothetical protein
MTERPAERRYRIDLTTNDPDADDKVIELAERLAAHDSHGYAVRVYRLADNSKFAYPMHSEGARR